MEHKHTVRGQKYFDWARHLSKLRLKFYVEGINDTLIPGRRPDVVVDPIYPQGCGYAFACALSPTTETPYVYITGQLQSLSHELGHALGLGHTTPYIACGREWRGWGMCSIYPGYNWEGPSAPS